MDTAPRYHINVFWYPDDGCWIADVPDLKSCSAHGDTPAEALAEAEIAVELWIETALDCNLIVPEHITARQSMLPPESAHGTDTPPV